MPSSRAISNRSIAEAKSESDRSLSPLSSNLVSQNNIPQTPQADLFTTATKVSQQPQLSAGTSGRESGSAAATRNGSTPERKNISEAGFKTPSRLQIGHGLKRTPSAAAKSGNATSSEASVKRLKRSHRPTQTAYDRGSLSATSITTTSLASPLFFSNSPQLRPELPARLSSSEAAAKMLGKANNEDTGIKTVTMARGTYNTSSPPATLRSHTRARKSNSLSRGERASDTPDAAAPNEMISMLDQIGITEFLESDERPTLVIDVGSPSNVDRVALSTIFVNAALRAQPHLLARISGQSGPEHPLIATPGHTQLRHWLFGSAPVGTIADPTITAAPSHNVIWSYSTIRTRMRIVHATVQGNDPGQLSTFTSPLSQRMTPRQGDRLRDAPSCSVAASEYGEAQDYFGHIATSPLAPSTSQAVAKEEVVPSIEQPTAAVNETVPAQTSSSQTFKMAPSQESQMSRVSVDFLSEAILSSACAADPEPLLNTNTKEIGFFDWTRLPDSETLPQHIRFARDVDWGQTSLGPIETWSQDLRQMCNLIMASPHPAAMYWGEDLIAIYNDAYVPLAGQKHPKLMGQKYCEAWSEIWEDVKDVFASAQSTGQATMKDDDCLFIRRHDSLEETYFSWSIIPMVGGDGAVMGLYNPAFEKTRRKIAERRMLTLREVGERTAAARDVKSFWEAVICALEYNEYDTPFVLLYSMHGDSESDESSVNSGSIQGLKQCFLEGSLGVPKDHVSAPEAADLNGSEGFIPVFREVMKTNRSQVLDVQKGELPQHLLHGLEERGFNDPPSAVVVCPIHPTTGDSTLGFLTMGVNPRRPYDEDYALFIQLLSRQLATSLASVVLFEEEIKRGRKAAKLAAMDKLVLSEALAARTQEAIESETKFTRMAEFAPVGMFLADREGTIAFCNDTWYEITRVPKEAASSDRWIDFVMEEDEAQVRLIWKDLIERAKPATAEFRFKAPWTDRNGVIGDTWVLFSAYPEKSQDGTLKSAFGSITNISQQKWAEGLQKRKMEEAVEMKRQQENFIDITSHEMRNPLSAILQCADELVSINIEAREHLSKEDEVDRQVFDNSIDAAQTISLCAQHQKRIVDDVLTLSKLDSALLMVTPVDAQPLAVVQRALKMFEGELQTADIDLTFNVDQSFRSMNVDWVKLDPSRVLQVLINLTTNAIKFTTSEKKRAITVTIAASHESPQEQGKNVVDYVPSQPQAHERTQGADWGDGEELYIHFAVKDTGRGLTEEEKKLLFQRFSQASPRTHVQYGGSGLGLFISKQLVDLQGGSIGVASTAGEGSTFAFYVKARRSQTQRPEPISSGKGNRISIHKSAAKKSPDSKTRDFAVPTSSTSGSPGAREKEPLHVLIVEDNLVNQKVLQKQLRNLGCVTQVANHGIEALDRLKDSAWWSERGPSASRLDVVLMDQEMPVMDGLTCTKMVREMESQGKLKAHVPIIAVTANARNEQIDKAMDAGMDDVVSKPFRLPDLIPKMEELSAKFRPDP